MRTRTFTAAAVLAVVPLAVGPAAVADPLPGSRAGTTTIALLGDTPYGPEQRVQFPALVDEVNRDRKVRLVLHAGDIKSGSESCGDALLSASLADYERFADPFVLTPGDNEWTDCHRTSAGSFVPTERLDRVRELFYPEPGRTLGRREATVVSQATRPTAAEHAAYVENVRFTRSRVVFASVHVVGSSNDLAPWDQLPGGDRPTERIAEFEARRAANLAWIDAAFDRAERTRAPGVVILMQAEPVEGDPGFEAERALL
ncbi:MAG: metallophosphoesterase, partial [Phycicoccus sp.]